ncbi:arsenite efflux transporter metallochaperone ArsD [Salipaludibacillus aurantiacus]|uniref:Arsenical resistance operon trans-acting repressor ArsD n=1 Tax=Salipaludibacillus aurantiacus TaxID=1601833 RepID=A0A1H9XCC3_9BACI|nr:arsenite efflux transporter metallochaperone ArsD [Salipaludibacillus aurantiacus]SES43303.1 Arsenical resistance operon trans-acting repressor ArsD [Salipaludibacillus aurantiacus]
MAKKIEIFDPALCCPTGVCGPDVDPELTRISRLHLKLVKNGYHVKRYNLAQEPDPFVTHKGVNELLEKEGPDALPAVVVDGKLAFYNRYPTMEEFSEWLGLDKEELQTKEPEKKINLL